MNGHIARKRLLTKDVVAKTGAIRGLLALTSMLFLVKRFRRERPPDVSQLDARMRRDIGLRTEVDMPDFGYIR